MICQKCGSQEFSRRFFEKGKECNLLFSNLEDMEDKTFFIISGNKAIFKKDFLLIKCKECGFKQLRNTLSRFKIDFLTQAKEKIKDLDITEQEEVLCKIEKMIDEKFFFNTEEELIKKLEELLN